MRELLVRAVPVPARAVSAHAQVATVRAAARRRRCRRRSAERRTRRYSVSLKALQRWSQERLTLDQRDDGTRRRGVPLRRHDVHQHGPAAAVSLSCEAGAARGRLSDSRAVVRARRRATRATRSMCRYISDREQLMASIAASGRCSASRSTTWCGGRGPPSPAGCYCEAESRQHKWGLVLETIHYAPRDGRRIARSCGRQR